MEAIKNINNEEAPIPAQHHHMEKDDQATVASHGTHRSNRSYGSRRSRGYPTGAGDSSKRWRRDDDTTTHYSRDRSQSQDPNKRSNASWRPSRSRDRSNSHPRDYYKGNNNNSNRTEHDTASTTQPDARERHQRSESCAPVAERAYTRDSTSVNHADFRRGRSSSVTSSRSEPPFKTGRRFRTSNSAPGRRFDSISQSRSPGRMMRPGPSFPKEGLEWPPCFESEGSAFIFHPASGMFYEQESDFFYDPKAKMYYGVRKGAYFRYDESQDPPFVETQRMDPTQGTPVTPVEPPVTLPPVNAPAQNLIAKPKIAIKLKTKKIKKVSNKVASISNDSSQSSDTSSLIPSMASKLQKEQVANMQKWKEKQAELQSLHSVSSPSGGGGVSAAAAAEEIKRTTKGEPICVICKRKFPTIEKLRLHEEKSELHKSNLAKAEQEQQQQQQQHVGEKRKHEETASVVTAEKQQQHQRLQQQYHDRAEKRRHLHGPQAVTSELPILAAAAGYREKPDAPDGLSETNIGNKLLQKMGWQSGSTTLGNKNKGDEEAASEKASMAEEIRKDWDRIEAIADSGAR